MPTNDETQSGCQHTPTTLLNLNAAAGRAAVSPQGFLNLVARGVAPRPVAIKGSRLRRWRSADVEQWLASLPTEQPPANEAGP
jgi:predicted DNA-binding transcriptional regulator AlpA